MTSAPGCVGAAVGPEPWSRQAATGRSRTLGPCNFGAPTPSACAAMDSRRDAAANPWNRQAIEPRNHRTASARIAERRLRATTVSRKWPDDGVNTAMAVAPATTCRDRLTGTRLAAPPFRLELLGATFPPPPSRHRFLAAVFPTPPSQHRAHAIIFLRPTSRHHPATAPDRRKPSRLDDAPLHCSRHCLARLHTPGPAEAAFPKVGGIHGPMSNK